MASTIVLKALFHWELYMQLPGKETVALYWSDPHGLTSRKEHDMRNKFRRKKEKHKGECVLRIPGAISNRNEYILLATI
jgi:hypothetical protein